MIDFFIRIFQKIFFSKSKNYYSCLQYETKYEKKSLPPWEEIVEMCYGQGLSNLSAYTIEKVIYAKSKDFRAVIYKKKDMYFIICEQLYAWDEEDEYEINEYLSGNGLPGYWFPIDNGVSVFDSIESAEKEVFSMSEFWNAEYERKHLPPWEEIVEMLYNQQLDCYIDEVIKVIYSEDKDLRAVILKNSKGFYSVSFEQICLWDEESEYEMVNYWSGGLPGYWSGYRDGSISTSSFYDTIETAEREIFSMSEFEN